MRTRIEMSTKGTPSQSSKKQDQANGNAVKNPPKDNKKEVRDAKNKMKFHSTKMDLNLKILREEMSSLSDTGNSLSRQMASMYRTLQQVKDDEEKEGGVAADDEDTYTDGHDSEPEVENSETHRAFEALDTEDDVNQMTDLDSESCSFPGRKKSSRQTKESGLLKSPKQIQVGDNRNANDLDGEKTPQPQDGHHFKYPDNSKQSTGDPHITPMSLSLTSTEQEEEGAHNNNHEFHHHHDHGRRKHGDDHSSDSESDDESLPDTSSDECSRCLCCSSLASYQKIPWRIQRRDSATTTEASDSSEYCSDSDEEEGHRRVPLYAKFSPFFFQEYASGSEETDECEKMDEDADSLPEQTRMSPLGRESSPARHDGRKENDGSTTEQPVDVTGKPGEKETQKVEEGGEEEEIDEQSSASVIEKIKRMQMKIQDESHGVEKQKPKTKAEPEKSELLSPESDIEPAVKSKPDVKKKPAVPSPEPKRHVSKSQMFIVAPPKANSGKGKKMMLTSGDQPMFEIPASCIDKEGKVTLRPDPKLAPEAFKSGKTITFQVKHTPDGIIATDGPMVLTTNPSATRTVLRLRSSQPSTPTTPTNTKSSVEVTPEGVINIRKRRTVPVKINPVQAIPVVDAAGDAAGHTCTHCNHHRQEVTTPQGEAVPRFVTRRVTTQQTTVTPMYGSTPGQPIVINQQGQQPGPQYVIHQQGGQPQQPGGSFIINQQHTQQHPGQPFTINQGGGFVFPQQQQQQQSFVINQQGGPQQRQIIVGPQPVQAGGPIQTISVTPSTMQQGAPIVYRTNPSTQGVQSFQISGSSPMHQPPVIRLGGSQQPIVRVNSGDGFTIPLQQATQPGGMRFVINQ